MTSKIPRRYWIVGNACWLSVDILVEHFPYLESEICLLDDAEIAFIDKKASKMNQYCYWVAVEIAIIEYLEDKKNDKSKI
jgi:hypothetical protein